MSLRQRRSEWFIGDLEHYAAYYDREGNWELAEKYLRAVAATLASVAEIPTLGHPTAFGAPELKDLRCLRVERPFQNTSSSTAMMKPLFMPREPSTQHATWSVG